MKYLLVRGLRNMRNLDCMQVEHEAISGGQWRSLQIDGKSAKKQLLNCLCNISTRPPRRRCCCSASKTSGFYGRNFSSVPIFQPFRRPLWPDESTRLAQSWMSDSRTWVTSTGVFAVTAQQCVWPAVDSRSTAVQGQHQSESFPMPSQWPAGWWVMPLTDQQIIGQSI